MKSMEFWLAQGQAEIISFWEFFEDISEVNSSFWLLLVMFPVWTLLFLIP